MFRVKLRALSRLSEFRKRKVMVLEDFRLVDLGFGEISLTKGSEDKLPGWLADYLENKGMIKTLDEITLEELGRILFNEKQNINVPASIVKVSPNFYSLSDKLLKKLRESKDLEALEQLRKASNMLNEIKSIRLRKIINIALLNITDQNLLSNLALEEYLLYSSLRDLISNIMVSKSGATT
ncbi:MAG: DNA replication complex GINS family protein [Sulfolobus sp.]|nr:DNA replication complex GINS family protein [Sulfolobus sp.]